MNKLLKKADIVLIVLLFALSLLPLVKFGQPAPACYAEIRQAGKVIERVQLTGHTGITEITTTYNANGQEKHNHIRIENAQITVTDADCPDKICMQTGAISQPGEIIACLPHQLIIEIKSE
jgi:hypothetical protein